jgi:hypothetical protein
MMNTCNPSTPKVEAGGLRVAGSLNYIVTLSLKEKNSKGNNSISVKVNDASCSRIVWFK